MTLTIVEVIKRSEQGRTEPYICRGNDGEVYFVKGRSATRQDLINEWMCANLAQALGLPIAPFAIAEVPQDLMDADLTGWLKDLGVGPVFASRKVMGQDLTASQVPHVPLAVRQDVLVFDWWVRNNDRHLTALGGNVNLLWKPHVYEEDTQTDTGLVVIDHNLALDKAFSTQEFCESHVFADDLAITFSDFVLRQTYSSRLLQAMEVWDKTWNNLPEAWHFVDLEQTMPCYYPKADVLTILSLAQSLDFWNLPA